jgi:hypothetical protein
MKLIDEALKYNKNTKAATNCGSALLLCIIEELITVSFASNNYFF